MTQEAEGKLERPLGALQQTPLPRERISLGTQESSRKLETRSAGKLPGKVRGAEQPETAP